MTKAIIGKQTPRTMAVVSLPAVLCASVGELVDDFTSGMCDVNVEVLLVSTFVVDFVVVVDCKIDSVLNTFVVRGISDENVEVNGDDNDEVDDCGDNMSPVDVLLVLV